MTGNPIPDSFTPGVATTGSRGQRVHPDAIEQSARLQRQMVAVGPDGDPCAWSLIGNGLSNQTFVAAPEGLIVIDTGECVEEMMSALKEVRQHTDAPVAACIYTHFHYVGGTRALLDANGSGDLPIFGHADIEANLRRFGGEVGPRYARGLIHQFGLMLPEDGPDALENVGLGLRFRNPAHAPFTHGYVPANHTFSTALRTRIAGLEVVMSAAPSDASDSITIWFPELKIAVNNLLWPALFNVFAIRGEEYRDPRVVIEGLDHLLTLPAEHLLGTHGPPVSGAEGIRSIVTDYRDAIQFLWDQTVRGANKGLGIDELIGFVQLPERFKRHYHTRQLYGLAEHHVRQIYCGLFGWFDENEANLFPLPPVTRAQRLIEGFGGADRVRGAADAALADADYRWALELSSWLVRCEAGPDGRADGGTADDRGRLAQALRGIAYNTTSANVRNWCLTRALDLEGKLNLQRFRGHRLREHEVAGSDPARYVNMLRVLVDPGRAGDLEDTLAWAFDDGARVGLQLRGGVAVPADPETAACCLFLSLETWAALLAGGLQLTEALKQGLVRVEGEEARARRFLRAFEVPAFA